MPPPDAGEGVSGALLSEALSYRRRGWAVVPVQFGGKKPLNPDDAHGRSWQDLRASEDDLRRWFGDRPVNVGVILGEASGGLVDVDLDVPAAIALAPRFLPKTEAAFGRAGKPRSHWLYCAQELKPRQFKDPADGVMLLELRGTGMQTVFPPSRHASGEVIDWASRGDPLLITPDRLEREACKLAAAALLARHWPCPGGRHDAALTLTGFLKRARWSDAHTAHFVASVTAAAGGDPDHAKRLATARDSETRHQSDRPLRGFPALADLVGEAVASKVSGWLNVTADTGSTSANATAPLLAHGSHVAQAAAVLEKLHDAHGEVVFCEGQFWVFEEVCWRPMSDPAVRVVVHELDAAPVRGRALSLTKSGIDGVIHELTVLADHEGFFDQPRRGINCANGLVTISATDGVALLPHDPAHRRRHAVCAAWSPHTPSVPPATSLFAQFLRGSFGEGEGADEIVALVGEAAGVAALGAAAELREPAALILYGPLAANGKSQLLQLMRGLVSPGAAAAVSPNTFSDEKRLVLLAGRALNACDELGGKAIFSDAFKCIISCEPTGARDLYKSAFEFRPIALHVFAANELPAFHRGLDRGVQRRVIIVPMTRVVPAADQVPHIAARILETEPDLVLAWAVAGARRALARLDLARPKLCVEAKSAWIAEGDVVLSWLFDEEEIGFQADAWASTKSVYEAFRSWATPRGFVDLPNINAFSRRVSGSGVNGVRSHRKSPAAGITGIVVRRGRGARE